MLELTDRSRQEMIEQNIGLVHSCAHRFKGRGIEYDDLFQAGCMGLVKACDAFDFDRGVRFSTYAVPVILGEMRRLFRDGGAVKVSRSLKELSLRVTRSRERYAVEFGRDPTVDELAAYTQLSREEVVEALSVSAPPVSLTVTSEDGEAQIDVPVQSPEEKLSDALALRQIIGQLEPRDRQLIILRYFLEKTQTQTAQQLGMTQVQVSRREKKILTAMRQKLL
ncbi:MAG: sigma-70 family RNA polymerase sigma factor [Clostridiales bacterium]|nr:sigma-70 family RNA polymerase sigma factor [Clostridiales bacterium]